MGADTTLISCPSTHNETFNLKLLFVSCDENLLPRLGLGLSGMVSAGKSCSVSNDSVRYFEGDIKLPSWYDATRIPGDMSSPEFSI